MKPSHRGTALGAGLIVLTMLLLAAESVIVRIQSTSLRKEPKFYSTSLVTLKAGTVLEKISAQSGWVQVKTSSGVIGWIHSSAVEARKLKLASVDKKMSMQASADEVALAGKGFNKQVEDSYKAKHKDADFAAVDRMLTITIPVSQVESFVKKGKLGGTGGK